jgi:hypothetical protein
MGASEDAIELLKRIATAVQKSAAALERMEKRSAAREPKEIASDRDLDSQYGNEKVHFDPRNWTGEKFKGRTMSECPAEFLDLLAEGHDYFASKNASAGDDKKAGYEQRSAARARGWAKRLRAGWKPAKSAANAQPADDYNAIDDDSNTGGGW